MKSSASPHVDTAFKRLCVELEPHNLALIPSLIALGIVSVSWPGLEASR